MIFAENQIEPIWFWSKCKLYQNSRKLKKKTISKVEMSCQGCASPRANDNSEPSGTLHARCGSVITSFGSAAGTAMRSWNHLLSTTPWSGKKRSVQLYLAPLADLLQCWIVQLNSVQFFSEQFIHSQTPNRVQTSDRFTEISIIKFVRLRRTSSSPCIMPVVNRFREKNTSDHRAMY